MKFQTYCNKAPYLEKLDHSINQQTVSADLHRKNLNSLVNLHFGRASDRVSLVYTNHFASTSVVFGRHWRNKKDIPSDLATLPRSAWRSLTTGFSFKKKLPDSSKKTATLSGKQAEIRNIVEIELLDLPGLDKEIQKYVAQYQSDFDSELNSLFAGLSDKQRSDMEHQLSEYVKRMSIPVEGAREALMFVITGLMGKGLGASGFGSSMATGQAAATAIYMSNVSWWTGLWASLTGVPGWVSVAGATSGFIAVALIAPLFAPLLEVGINKFRGEKMLFDIVDQARTQMIKPPDDVIDVLGKLAVYLQTLPDIIVFLSKIKP